MVLDGAEKEKYLIGCCFCWWGRLQQTERAAICSMRERKIIDGGCNYFLTVAAGLCTTVLGQKHKKQKRQLLVGSAKGAFFWILLDFYGGRSKKKKSL